MGYFDDRKLCFLTPLVELSLGLEMAVGELNGGLLGFVIVGGLIWE